MLSLHRRDPCPAKNVDALCDPRSTAVRRQPHAGAGAHIGHPTPAAHFFIAFIAFAAFIATAAVIAFQGRERDVSRARAGTWTETSRDSSNKTIFYWIGVCVLRLRSQGHCQGHRQRKARGDLARRVPCVGTLWRMAMQAGSWADEPPPRLQVGSRPRPPDPLQPATAKTRKGDA